MGTTLTQIEILLLDRQERGGLRQDALIEDLQATLCSCQKVLEAQLAELYSYGFCGSLNVVDKKVRKRITAVLNRAEPDFHHQLLERQISTLRLMLGNLRTSVPLEAQLIPADDSLGPENMFIIVSRSQGECSLKVHTALQPKHLESHRLQARRHVRVTQTGVFEAA